MFNQLFTLDLLVFNIDTNLLFFVMNRFFYKTEVERRIYTHRSHLPVINFHLSDIQIYTPVMCHVLTNENMPFLSDGKKI